MIAVIIDICDGVADATWIDKDNKENYLFIGEVSDEWVANSVEFFREYLQTENIRVSIMSENL